MQTIQLRSSSSSNSDRDASSGAETWVDIEAGDDAGRRWLANQSGLDAPIVERMLEPAPATFWRRFGQGLHFHIHTVMPVEDAASVAITDLGIWFEPGRIITVRGGRVAALEQAAADCSAGIGPSSSWALITFVLSEALSRLEQNLHRLTATIDQIEDDLLTGDGDFPIRRVAELQKQLMYTRRFRVSVANMANFASSQHGPTVDRALRDELDEIVNAVAQHQELLSLSIDRASALQSEIRDELANSMNSATYRFTWVATVFLPLSFLTGLLGINVAGIPGDHNPLAFWLVCGSLCVVAAAWGIAVGRVSRPFRKRGGRREP